MHITDAKIIIDGLTIYYKTAGDIKKQPLVFLHGFPMRLYGYPDFNVNPVIDAFAKHFYVIAPEEPGVFRSEPPNKPWGYKELADTIHSFIKKLNIKTPIIAGQSFGGAIAATYAENYPEDIKLLILIDSSTTNYRRALKARLSAPIAIPLYKALVTSKFVPFSIRRSLVHLVHRTPLSDLSEERVMRYGRFVSNKLMKLAVDYKTLKTPLILVWGNKDEITPIQDAHTIHTDVKESKLVVLDGKHTILYEKPEYVIDEIMKNINI